MIESSLTYLFSLSLAQWVGIGAYLVGLYAFTRKNSQQFKSTLLICQSIICLHFIMMGAISGAFSAGISCARTYTSTRTHSIAVMWGFILLIWATGLYNLNHNYELLTMLGASIATWGMFKSNGILLRVCVMLCSMCWLIHNLLLGSIGGTLMEISFVIMNALTIFRIQRANRLSAASISN